MSDQSDSMASANPYVYIITETSGPTSFDPLEADNTANMPVARMIYATPLEASEDNQLKSQLLDSFGYDPEKKIISWKVKSGLKFDDGSNITADDVAFSVARMANARPKFPVIENIVGLDAWLKSKAPLKNLPSGISVKGNLVTISLNHPVKHPLFRFCLELFSVIPRKCVDQITSKINCDSIPASGYYRIASAGKETLLFQKRTPGKIEGMNAPESIKFEYIVASDVTKRLSQIPKTAVMAGNESMFSPTELKSVDSQFATRYLPASRFSVIQLNQNSKAFQEKRCRRYFAESFRQSYMKITSQTPEPGVFTKILPGYLSQKELLDGETLTDKDRETCKAHFEKVPISWGYTKQEENAVFFQILRDTLKTLTKAPLEPTIAASRSEAAELFANGKISIFNAGSGFWALDPSGDMKMLFTPNLHKALQHVANDPKLQDLITEMQGDTKAYAKANKYLFEDAKFNVYAHPRRFFAAKDPSILAELPFAVTSPAPWQVFKVGR
ncbi:MAG: ABC transporter substrate-binding protein [Bdellovibrionales bacterium]